MITFTAKTRKSLLDLMIEIADDPNNDLTDDDLRQEIDTFAFGVRIIYLFIVSQLYCDLVIHTGTRYNISCIDLGPLLYGLQSWISSNHNLIFSVFNYNIHFTCDKRNEYGKSCKIILANPIVNAPWRTYQT